MQILSLVLGILAFLGMFVASLPCFGSLNWINIPFSAIGLIVSIIAFNSANQGSKGTSIAGIVLCAIALIFGAIRLMAGGGVL